MVTGCAIWYDDAVAGGLCWEPREARDDELTNTLHLPQVPIRDSRLPFVGLHFSSLRRFLERLSSLMTLIKLNMLYDPIAACMRTCNALEDLF